MRFEGKVVVITGGASGIGLAAARRFHGEGAQVVIADLNDELGAAAIRELGPERALYQHADVAAWPEVEDLMQAARRAFGGWLATSVAWVPVAHRALGRVGVEGVPDAAVGGLLAVHAEARLVLRPADDERQTQ